MCQSIQWSSKSSTLHFYSIPFIFNSLTLSCQNRDISFFHISSTNICHSCDAMHMETAKCILAYVSSAESVKWQTFAPGHDQSQLPVQKMFYLMWIETSRWGILNGRRSQCYMKPLSALIGHKMGSDLHLSHKRGQIHSSEAKANITETITIFCAPVFGFNNCLRPRGS